MLATDGTLAHGERTMNTKRLAALAALSALLSTAAPAMAVTQTGTVQVEWNYAITASMTMYTQTTASKTHTTASPTDIYVYNSGAGAQCNGSSASSSDADAGIAEGVPPTVNFGNVVALSAAYSGCLETNAVDAYYTTNDSAGAKFSVSESGGPSDYDTNTNGSLLCIEGDGWTASTSSSGAATTWTASGNAAAPTVTATNACPANYEAITSAGQQFYSLTGPAAGNDLNMDMLLEMGPQMQSGAQTVTLTYTMITN